MNCEYVREYYKVPAEIGRRVIVSGESAIIVADRGNYIGVTFDRDKPGTIYNCHPTNEVVYGEIGKIRKMTPSEKRYQDFLNSEYPGTFAEYLGINIKGTVTGRFPVGQ